MTEAIFISDLHLTVDRPDLYGAFSTFMDTTARTTQELYILGDLFDYWVGDDGMLPFHNEVARILHHYSKTHGTIYFMPGNRDFAIGTDFLNLTGMHKLEDPYVITICTNKILLTHGDLLCGEDKKYQLYRKLIRNPYIIRMIMLCPVSCRQKLANRIRQESSTQKKLKNLSIMDVTPSYAISIMNEYRVQLLIHGHTHRPNIHSHELAGKKTGIRYVLGDWDETGWYLSFNSNTLQLHKFQI